MKCLICDRSSPFDENFEKHHLNPRSRKETIKVCIDCGDQIHNLFSNKELEKNYNTLEKLKNEPKIKKWIKWARKKDFHICMKRKKRRKR